MSKIYATEAGPKSSRYRESPCSVCGVRPSESGRPVLLCSACKAIPYCGKECQRKGWSIHKARCHELRILLRLEEEASSVKDEQGIPSHEIGSSRGGPSLQVRYRLMEDFVRLHAPSIELAWTSSIWASTKNDPFKFDFQRRILKVDYKYRPDSKGDPSRAFEILTCRFHKLHEIAPKLRMDLNTRKILFDERIERIKAKHPDRPIRVLYILSTLDKQAWIWSFFPLFETVPLSKEQYVHNATAASWLQDLKDQMEVGLIHNPNDVASNARGRLRKKGNKWIWVAEQGMGGTKDETVDVKEEPEEEPEEA